MSRYDKQGKRIFVHCHAGTGRTGLVIASYLYYCGNSADGHEAVKKVQTQRPGSLKKKSQSSFVVNFCKWLHKKRFSLYPHVRDAMSYKREGGQNLERSYAQVMQDNLSIVHGKDAQEFKYFPKFLGVCLQRL